MRHESVSQQIARVIDVSGGAAVDDGRVYAAFSSVDSLARVLSPERPRVLMVDRERHQVVFANAEMLELLGHPDLPLGVEDVVCRLPLVDHHGEPMGVSLHPVTSVARGEEVSGLEARTPPTADRGTGDGGDTDRGDADQSRFWINGLDVARPPDGDGPRTLGVVVLMRIDQDAVAARSLSSEAIGATDLSFSISDHMQSDEPLVYVNPAFERLTGYAIADAVGRNCRFLQGPETDPAAVDTLRGAVRDGSAAVVTLLNYRADGSTFWNEVTISPVREDGQITHFVGIQRDVSEHVEARIARHEAEGARQAARQEAERARGVAEEEQARAQRAHARLGFLDQAGRVLNANLPSEQLAEKLVGLLVPRVADHAAVAVGDARAMGPSLHSACHGEHGGRLAKLAWDWAWADAPSQTVAVDDPDADPPGADRHDAQPKVRTMLEELGLHHVEFSSMEVGAQTMGGVVVGYETAPDPERELRGLLEQVLSRATPAFLAAKRLREQGTIAEALQRFLRPPDLPEIERYEIAGRYEPAGAGVEVGGDFYDIVPGRDSWIVVLGDVCGKGPDAAAVTGIVRSTVRALAPYVDSPTEMLRGLHRAVYQQVPDDRFVTAVCAYIRVEGVASRISLAIGGHARPVLVRHGMSRQVGVPGQLLGVLEDVELTATDIIMEPGNTLVMMTDGVVETPTSYEMTRVMQIASEHSGSADSTATAVMNVMKAQGRDVSSRDDAAVLALRYTG